MINPCFSLGIFSKTLKTAKVLSIFKKGNAKISRIIAQFPYFLLFPKFMNVQFTIELFRFLTAIISLFPIYLVLEKVISPIMPSLT